MSKKKGNCHDRRVTVCLTEQEFEKVQAWTSETTSQTISEYIRHVVTKKPVTFRVRNQTAEDFLENAIELKNQLTTTGQNLEEAIKKLCRQSDRIHFRNDLENMDGYIFSIQRKTEEIKDYLYKIYQQWSQK
jgi:hypothetical protein